MLDLSPIDGHPQVAMPARHRLMWHDFTTGRSRFGDRTDAVRVPGTPVPPWNEGVRCCTRAIYTNRYRNVGALFVDALHCTDMTGCIALFRGLAPGVRQITVWQSDGRHHSLNIVYRLNSRNAWEAIKPHVPVSRSGSRINPDNYRYFAPVPMVESFIVSSWCEAQPIDHRNPWVIVVKDPKRKYCELTYCGEGSGRDWLLTKDEEQELLRVVREGHAANKPRARAGSLLLGMGPERGTAHLMTEDHAHRVMAMLVGWFKEKIETRARQPEEFD